MSFGQSPGVTTREIDLSTIIPNVAADGGAIGGVFRWGPVGRRILVDSEPLLAQRFGKPTNHNPETFFNAASFLAYTKTLYVVRAANTTATSPIITATANSSNATVTTASTTSLSAGMILVAANNSNIRLGATISSITNSTAFVIDSAAKAVTNGSVELQFVANTGAFSAIANTAQVANLAGQIVKNDDAYTSLDGTFDSGVQWVARYPGSVGSSLRISVCDSSAGFTSTLNLASYGNGGANVYLPVGSNTANVTVTYVYSDANTTAAQTAVNTAAYSLIGAYSNTDLLEFGNTTIGTSALKVTATSNVTISSNSTVALAKFNLSFDDQLRLVSDQTMTANLVRYWEYFDLIDRAPAQSDYQLNFGNTSANDELHVVISDHNGLVTGVPGTVLESYRGLSRATDAKTIDGNSNYYKTVINTRSKYVWWCNDRSTAVSNTASNLTSATNTAITQLLFKHGYDGSDEGAVSVGVLASAYDMFASAEDSDVMLIMQGKARGGTAGGQLANYIIDNISEVRTDCVTWISPDKNDVVFQDGNEADNIKAFRDTLRYSSYGFLDSGYKFMYDRYNDIYRWVPLNGDIAGLMARTVATNDAWWSPAGLNRGQLKNLLYLAWNPREAQRDEIYKSDINPVVSLKGRGTVLYGDKTLLGKPSAFDRINVRMLLIVLRKAIKRAAEYSLFEFNDAFTRAQFKNMVNPYLRDVKGRRGLTDFLVKCDEENNTPEVIDRNEFIGDILLKPARSINYIKLNFVVTKTGVSFNEVIGKF